MDLEAYKIFNKDEYLIFKRKGIEDGKIEIEFFINAVNQFNKYLNIFKDLELPIGNVLGLRNLSAFIGELFNLSVCKISKGKIKKNPHQDGYPDLLIMDEDGKKLWKKLSNRLHEKQPFSNFQTGGIEVKATCGDLKSGTWFTKEKIKKPDIGEQRLDFVTGYNWKSHHRFTNNLIGIIWDFIDDQPKIISIMYSNSLDTSDWGQTVKPKEGGGRTTSVSIMNKKGINKMFSGMILAIDNDVYLKKILKRMRK